MKNPAVEHTAVYLPKRRKAELFSSTDLMRKSCCLTTKCHSSIMIYNLLEEYGNFLRVWSLLTLELMIQS